MKNLIRSVAPVFALAMLSLTTVAADKKPNIVLIFADDVGREVLGCYGGKTYPTPHLDALAESGMLFTHAYAMPVCHPSRVCIMTGKYPARMGNPKWGDFAADQEDKTFGHLLKNAGYRTAVAGKWQIATMSKNPDHCARLGFDDSCVFAWHEGARYHDPMLYENGALKFGTEGKYGPELYVDFLVESMKAAKKQEKPFFLYYPMALCHDVTDDLGKGKYVPFYKENRWMNYVEMAKSMDDMVGRLVKEIDEAGERGNTLIVFTTDNGTANASYLFIDENGKMQRPPFTSEWQGEQVRGGKGTFTDLGTRVPLIVSWPGKVEAGVVADDLVDLSDYLPTLADFAGTDVPAEWGKIDGVSFKDRLLEGKPSSREWAYAETKGKRFAKTRDFKLYQTGQFFDLKADPKEKSPIKAELEGDAAQAREMLQKALDSVPLPRG